MTIGPDSVCINNFPLNGDSEPGQIVNVNKPGVLPERQNLSLKVTLSEALSS